MARVFPADFRLYLASQSPRRRELLQGLGVPFTVVSSHGEEGEEGPDPGSIAELNASNKARGAVLPLPAESEAAVVHPAFVLACDTIVVRSGRVLGKPRSRDEAAEMLRFLSGERHQVVSGLALGRATGRPPQTASSPFLTAHEKTTVFFSPLDEADLGAYLDSGEWEGKAGAYAIQGLAALFVERLEGDYANVVGLPLALLARLFRRHGFDLLRGKWLSPGAPSR